MVQAVDHVVQVDVDQPRRVAADERRRVAAPCQQVPDVEADPEIVPFQQAIEDLERVVEVLDRDASAGQAGPHEQFRQ